MTTKPVDVPLLYIRPCFHPGFPAELVISYGGEPSIVYGVRLGQLANLAVDATKFALAGEKE